MQNISCYALHGSDDAVGVSFVLGGAPKARNATGGFASQGPKQKVDLDSLE